VAREVTPAFFIPTTFVSYNGRKSMPEPLQQRLCRQFCTLQATLVDCEGDLESIQELERCYNLPSVDGKEGSIPE
jgi:hypothetical protein